MGDRIRLWEDIWCGNRPLKDVFPDLYAIIHHFFQNFNDWAVEGSPRSLNFSIHILISRLVVMVCVGN